jgi:hypothetical protein
MKIGREFPGYPECSRGQAGVKAAPGAPLSRSMSLDSVLCAPADDSAIPGMTLPPSVRGKHGSAAQQNGFVQLSALDAAG